MSHLWRATFLGLSAALLSCHVSTADNETAQVLTHVSAAIALPAFQDLATQSLAFENQLRTYCAVTPQSAAQLSSLQLAWRGLHATYVQTHFYAFAPDQGEKMTSDLGFWPVKPSRIKEALQRLNTSPELASEAAREAWVQTLGANQRGLGALEYLLFPAPADPDLSESVNCRLGVALAHDVTLRSAALHGAWQQTWAPSLQQVGAVGSRYGKQAEAVAAIITYLAQETDIIAAQKLGRPMGRGNGVPDPDAFESLFSDNAADDIQNGLDGLERLYFGVPTQVDGVSQPRRGLAFLVPRFLNDAVAEEIATLRASVARIPRPWRQALTARPELFEQVYQDTRRLKNTLKNEVAGALGVSVYFSDNDGD